MIRAMFARKSIQALCLGLVCFVFFFLTHHGGVRAPDEEVVFQVAESLAGGRGYALTSDLAGAPGFGAAKGVDGKEYSVYPPGNSVWLAPMVALAREINATGWYEGIGLPPSYYVDSFLQQLINPNPMGNPGGNPRDHALRFLVTTFNLVTSVLCVLMFWLMALRLARSDTAAFAAALVFALGTLVWAYSNTIFSETLTTLFALASLHMIMGYDRSLGAGDSRSRLLRPTLSGLCLGFAASAHISAVLFAPFYLLYLIHLFKKKDGWMSSWMPALTWGVGFVGILFLVGIYNHTRFGSFLESGRSISEFNQVIFYLPWTALFWHGLFGLTVGWGKGLLLFCPAVVVGLIGWPGLFRRHRALALVLFSVVGVRILFFASYYDWHGGFCLGPRYLVPCIPFLVLPLASWIAARLEKKRFISLYAFALAAWICVAQQFYLALGEIFIFYHVIRFQFYQRAQNIFAEDLIYLHWDLSPLHHLHETNRASWLLMSMPGTNFLVWLTGSLILGVLTVLAVVWWRRSAPGPAPD